MEMNGERVLEVPRAKAWEALNDPAVLRECISGCESIELTGENQYQVVMTAAVGPVKAKFKGKLTLCDVEPPSAYRLTFEGQGGVAGFAKGGAKVALGDEGNSTRLIYAVNASVGGKLAQIGSRLIDSAAKKFADDFFNRFQERLAQDVAASENTILEITDGDRSKWTDAKVRNNIAPAASGENVTHNSNATAPGASIQGLASGSNDGIAPGSGETVTASAPREASSRWLWWAAAAVAVAASIYYSSDRRS